jgi:hypothetical protein
VKQRIFARRKLDRLATERYSLYLIHPQ